jgi:tRNA 2-thiouridine synthesizing protein E
VNNVDDNLFDQEGFLNDLNHWTEQVAETIAIKEGITLSDKHWEIIFLLRRFHGEFERSPNMRALINYLKKSLKEEELKEKANSIYLLTLFPESPAKIASKVAGLPKPENCL